MIHPLRTKLQHSIMRQAFLCLAVAATSVTAADERGEANPIRKVVTMLQKMQKQVEAEGVKEKELFDKFMCYCKNGAADLSKAIGDADTKVPELGSNIEEAESQLTQYKEDIKKAQVDRSAAKTAMEEATAIRQKEASEYAALSTDLKTNIAAIAKATVAIEKGMEGAFLQSEAAQVLKKIALSNTGMLDADRQDLAAFLSGGNGDGYSPASGQITGILKEMKDTMQGDLDEATATEKSALTTYDNLMAAKTKEVNALTQAIEDKTRRVGELGIQIVQMKEDLSDTEEALIEDKKFLAELSKSCSTKEAEWAQICKTRNEEILALSETIKILNDDDALEIFKKTLPSASASFVQVLTSTKARRAQASKLVQNLILAHPQDHQKFDFIMLAIRGKTAGFEKVIKMIDNMVALLKEEQMNDEHKKEYCNMQFDFVDDKKKGLERTVSDLATAIDDAKEGISTLKTDIEALDDGIRALDKSVAEATENRKEENDDYQNLIASDAAAKDLLGFAKNRLNKFYNPKLYKPEAASFVQISAHSRADPGPAPEAPGAYKKKGEESTGVIGMIDLLIKELDTEMTEAKTEERLAQEEYEELMQTSAEKRATDSKILTEKEGTKANLEAELAAKGSEKKDTEKELYATLEYLSSLHGECDWLLKFFDMRKEARSGEIDALGKAKAVLSGADFSMFMQTGNKFLNRG